MSKRLLVGGARLFRPVQCTQDIAQGLLRVEAVGIGGHGGLRERESRVGLFGAEQIAGLLFQAQGSGERHFEVAVVDEDSVLNGRDRLSILKAR